MTNDMFFIGSDNLNYVPILTRQNWTFSQFYSPVYQGQARPFSSMIRHLLIMQTRGPDCFFLRSYITEREGNTFQMQTRSVFWLQLDFSNTKCITIYIVVKMSHSTTKKQGALFDLSLIIQNKNDNSKNDKKYVAKTAS